MPGVARRDLYHILRCAFGDNFAALNPAFGAEVDDPIGGLNDVEIMFDDHHAIALFDQTVEHFEQFADILEMQAGGGLV